MQCNGLKRKGIGTNNAMQWPKEKRHRDKQCNGLKRKDKGTNNDLRNTTQKTED
jgi:hypothetical protein